MTRGTHCFAPRGNYCFAAVKVTSSKNQQKQICEEHYWSHFSFLYWQLYLYNFFEILGLLCQVLGLLCKVYYVGRNIRSQYFPTLYLGESYLWQRPVPIVYHPFRLDVFRKESSHRSLRTACSAHLRSFRTQCPTRITYECPSNRETTKNPCWE